MRPSQALAIHRVRIREIVRDHGFTDVRVFGSASNGQDTTESDLDLLVEPTAKATLMDVGAVRLELKELLGIEVDVLTPNALPDRCRDHVLRTARPV